MKNKSGTKQPTKDLPERIEPGEYTAICYRTDYGISFGGKRKLYVRFRIWEGPHAGFELSMICTTLKSNRSYRQKLYDQWSLVLGRTPGKGERFSAKIFKNRMYRVWVRDTTRKMPNGELKPHHMQYSVVDTILEPLTGVPTDEH